VNRTDKSRHYRKKVVPAFGYNEKKEMVGWVKKYFDEGAIYENNHGIITIS